MRILHTSDWHLGHRLHEQSQHDVQSRFLDWLLHCIVQQEVDLLLVSGDVFDNGTPSAQSLKLYYDFLVKLHLAGGCRVVITAGNHDAPGTLDAPRALLQSLDITVVGKATGSVSDEIVSFDLGDVHLVVAAVPFLRDQDIRRAVSGESFEQVSERYNKAIVTHYRAVADACLAVARPGTVIVAMGHVFATGASTSGSEQSIYVGNLGDISAHEFPPEFDYVALGHLHRSQVVAGKEHIRYSGSPYVLSFSEVGVDKTVTLVVDPGSPSFKIQNIVIPQFRSISRLRGTIDECLGQASLLDQDTHELTPWVELILQEETTPRLGFADVQKACSHLNVDILKVSYQDQDSGRGLDVMAGHGVDVKDLDPLDIFRLKCSDQGFDLEANPGIVDAFHEVIQLVSEAR